jgi:hypothetical protein
MKSEMELKTNCQMCKNVLEVSHLDLEPSYISIKQLSFIKSLFLSDQNPYKYMAELSTAD